MKGLKVHDYHILMQHVLPLFVALYCQKDQGLRTLIWVLCFNEFVPKPLDPNTMKDLSKEVAMTL